MKWLVTSYISVQLTSDLLSIGQFINPLTSNFLVLFVLCQNIDNLL